MIGQEIAGLELNGAAADDQKPPKGALSHVRDRAELLFSNVRIFRPKRTLDRTRTKGGSRHFARVERQVVIHL